MKSPIIYTIAMKKEDAGSGVSWMKDNFKWIKYSINSISKLTASGVSLRSKTPVKQDKTAQFTIYVQIIAMSVGDYDHFYHPLLN